MEVYDIESERNELEKYAILEGSEIGELCIALLHVANFASYMGDDFHAALVEEIKGQLEMFKNDTKIIETERTHTEKYTELEWLD